MDDLEQIKEEQASGMDFYESLKGINENSATQQSYMQRK